MHVLAVRDARHCADVHADAFGDVLQNHGLQIHLIATQKVGTLVGHNGLHGLGQGFLPLGNRIHKPLRRIHFLLDEGQGFTGGSVLLAALRIGVHHLSVGAAHTQLWGIPAVELQHNVLAIHGQQEVGNHVVNDPRGLAASVAGLGIESRQLIQGCTQTVLVQIQGVLEFVVVLLGKGFVVVAQQQRGMCEGHLAGIVSRLFLALSHDLKGQALLQVPGADAGRVQGLHHVQRGLEL